MPGSSIQVIGVEGALFSHIRIWMPLPKHGIVFQYLHVNNAPREVRDSVTRAMAAKLSIVARLDYYRGEMYAEFVDAENTWIDGLMETEMGGER